MRPFLLVVFQSRTRERDKREKALYGFLKTTKKPTGGSLSVIKTTKKPPPRVKRIEEIF